MARIRIARLSARGQAGRRPPVAHRFVRHPQRQAASPPKPCVVLPPVPHTEFHLRNMMTAFVVVFVRHGADRFGSFGSPTAYQVSRVSMQQRRSDMSVVGTAIHACIALSFMDRSVLLTETEVGNILNGFEVMEYLSASAVLRQVRAFHGWIESRWPDATPYAEIAVQSVLASGQVLNGRVDLLLETEDGWILIDHKSSQLAPDHWDQLAAEYGAQITAYATAVEQASGRTVLENWLFMPVAGGGLALAMD